MDLEKVDMSGWELTPRQAEILDLLSLGYTNAEIASELHISVKTVKYHLIQAYQTTGAKTRVDAARHAFGLPIYRRKPRG